MADQHSGSSRGSRRADLRDMSNEVLENGDHSGSYDRNGSRQDLVLVPKDKYNFIYISFIVLGITTLLPWNFFITATDYWMYKFRNVTNQEHDHPSNRTPLQTFFESYLAIASNVAMLTTMILNTFYGQRIAQKKRIYVSLIVMLIVFIITTVFVAVDTDQMQDVFFGITMLLVVLISVFSAVFQSAIFGVVASFPNHCMHAMVNGQAVAGLLAVGIQMISMANNEGPTTSGLWYFIASTIFLALTIVCYWSMDNEYTRHYLLRMPSEDQLASLSVNSTQSRTSILEALRDCWQMATVVVLAFWVSLAVFPAVGVLVVPEHPNSSLFTGRFFIPLATFVTFNLGDLIGRMISSYIRFPLERKNWLIALAAARTLIPALILFCNVVPRSHTSVWFTNDYYYPAFMTLTALTNGYVFSAAMVLATENCDRNRFEQTGFIMASASGIGLTLGSFSSNVLLRVI